MFSVGAHYAFSRSLRHASAKPYIFGMKDNIEIFDLVKTNEALQAAKDYMAKLAKARKNIIFVATKNEAREAVKEAALAVKMPYVVGGWKGGTLTNFSEMKKRIEKLRQLISDRDNGRLAKFTKKEQIVIGRDIAKLERNFGGLIEMRGIPDAIVVVDAKKEEIAVSEAKALGVKVIAITSSDADFSILDYPIPANDASRDSIAYFINQLKDAYLKNLDAEPTV